MHRCAYVATVGFALPEAERVSSSCPIDTTRCPLPRATYVHRGVFYFAAGCRDQPRLFCIDGGRC